MCVCHINGTATRSAWQIASSLRDVDSACVQVLKLRVLPTGTVTCDGHACGVVAFTGPVWRQPGGTTGCRRKPGKNGGGTRIRRRQNDDPVTDRDHAAAGDSMPQHTTARVHRQPFSSVRTQFNPHASRECMATVHQASAELQRWRSGSRCRLESTGCAADCIGMTCREGELAGRTHLHVFEHHVAVVQFTLQEAQLQQLKSLSLEVRFKVGLLNELAAQHAPAIHNTSCSVPTMCPSDAPRHHQRHMARPPAQLCLQPPMHVAHALVHAVPRPCRVRANPMPGLQRLCAQQASSTHRSL